MMARGSDPDVDGWTALPLALPVRRGLLAGAVVAVSLCLGSVGCEQPRSAGVDQAAATECSATQPIGSREYKLMLEASAFAGSSPEIAVAAFQQELLQAVATRLDREVDGDLAELDKARTVRFLDTPGDCSLRSRGWSLRERDEEGEREVTLKYRSADRYLAASADLDPADHVDGKTKLEQDIKPGYVSVYSHSTKTPLAADANLGSISEPLQMFPGLEQAGIDPDRELAVVGGLVVEERVYGDLVIDLGKLEAEMSLTLWYVQGEADPAVAEVSFKYEADDEDFPAGSVERGVVLFDVLQGLTAWQAADSKTKTAFAYAYDPTFCGP